MEKGTIFTNGNRVTSGNVAPVIITDPHKGTALEKAIRHHERIDTLLTPQRMEGAREVSHDDGADIIEGVGQRVANIPLRDFLDWDTKYRECWNNKGFVREWIRDNPDSRPVKKPRSRPAKITMPRTVNAN